MRHPNWVKVPSYNIAVLSAANSNRDGSGTLVTLSTGVVGGHRIKRIIITPTGTVTDGMVRLYVKIGGASAALLTEVKINANVPSATTPVDPVEVEFPDGLDLPDNTYLLQGSTEKAETFNVHVMAGDYGATSDV